MSDSERKWTNFLPDGLERWLRGKDKDEDREPEPVPAPGVEWRLDEHSAPPGVSSVPVAPPGVEWTPDATRESFRGNSGAEPPRAEWAPGAAARESDTVHLPPRPCAHCGGEVDVDGYCTLCGAKATKERDHYREEPAGWVVGVCDRGIRHTRNEDAMALAASQTPGERAVLIVCDGVSSSEDSDVASLAGAIAARDVLWANQPKGVGTAESRSAAMRLALEQAVEAANTAVVDNTALDSANAASATFAAAVISDNVVFHANLGDSRIYWLPDGAAGRQLSVDDSVAQLRMAEGVSREEAETGEGAHAITKWLGRDAPDLTPNVGELAVDGHGWVLVCSDGLWNYASTPDELGAVLSEAVRAEPPLTGLVDVADRLVAWANQQGGKDNITVALARLGEQVAVVPPVTEEPQIADPRHVPAGADGLPTADVSTSPAQVPDQAPETSAPIGERPTPTVEVPDDTSADPTTPTALEGGSEPAVPGQEAVPTQPGVSLPGQEAVPPQPAETADPGEPEEPFDPTAPTVRTTRIAFPGAPSPDAGQSGSGVGSFDAPRHDS